jgi:hypothetical protein
MWSARLGHKRLLTGEIAENRATSTDSQQKLQIRSEKFLPLGMINKT